MKRWVLDLYHGLPAPLRSVAAGLHGRRLSRWRYGPETARLVEAAFERERWTAEQWRRWREERMAFVLERAATRVPYYRAHWSARRGRGDRASWDVLEHWPVLEKQEVRRHPEAFLADDCRPSRMFPEQTSGTTGTPLRLWLGRDTVRAWYALFEARWRRWHGVSRDDPWAIIGGQLVVPSSRRRPPYWVWNRGLNQLYLSAYHVTSHTAPAYLDAMRHRGVRYLLGYTSGLYALARAALQTGGFAGRMAVVITNAEPVTPAQREVIEQAFGCPLRETYGMSEIVAAAGECSAGRLHLWPEVGWLEVQETRFSAGSPKAGEFVCTGLLNSDMPLIRYRVGDRGALGSGACPCGRLLPTLDHVEGRTDDVLYTRDGRVIGRLDPIFKARLRIQEAQIIQESLDLVRVRFVPAADYDASDGEAIVAGLRDRMGDVAVVLEAVDTLPRSANGKLRAVVNQLPLGERAGLEAR